MQQPLTLLFDHNHEQLAYRFDKYTGLRALIAVHNTNRGPSLGGTRLWKYDSIDDAVLDVLRLSEGMTYKNAVAGLALGGGKSVIMADGKEDDPVIRSARFQAFGRFIDSLGGSYIAAEDVGTKPTDMIDIGTETAYVSGMPPEMGGSGDPSPVTAFGVYRGMQALIEEVFQTESFADLHVAIQGLGKVGLDIAQYLLDHGATVTGTDVNASAIAEAKAMGIAIVEPDAIYDMDCDIFSPCALGASINDETIPRLKAKVIAGCANNQLADETCHSQVLKQKGIVYAVDYVINAGGVINVASEVEGFDEEVARQKASDIYYTMKDLLSVAEMEDIPMTIAARRVAEQRLQQEPVA